jgi:ATP phosphoribosyltransferase regulatory subunit
LRSQGNRVVQGFEGQKVDFQEMKCDRQIIKVDGKYIVQSLS